MSRIREKATESEAVVRDITKDIQVLDLAKKNLTTSTITLKRLQMLGTSILFRYPISRAQLRNSELLDTIGGSGKGEKIQGDFT